MIRKIFLAAVPVILLATLVAESMNSTGIAGRTGAPNETNCSACHSGQPLNASGGSISFSNPNMPGNVYTPGQTYNMSVTVSRTGFNKYGVGIVALTAANQNGGTLNITDAASTQIRSATVSGVSRRNVVHTGTGSTGSGTKTYNFSWTAPAIGTGNVTFYFAGNAANGNGTTTGDYIYTGSVVLTEVPCNTPTTPSVINGSSSFCSGGSNVLSVSPDPTATSYTWTLPNGWSGTSTTNTITITAGNSSGTVTVTANNACGSSPSRSLAVTSSNITTTVTTTDNVCAGASAGAAQITSAGGVAPYNYQWTPAVSSVSSANGLGSGSYSVVITDAAGCSASQSFTITEPTALTVQTGSSQTACEGSSVVLGGSPVASGGVQPYTFLWNDGSGNTLTSANPSYTVTGSANWQLTVTDANGCVSTGSAIVTANPLPVQPIITFSNDSLVSSVPGSLQWYLNGTALTGATEQNLFPQLNGDYTVTLTDAVTGCSNTSSVYSFISTGLDSPMSLSHLAIHPNPANSMLTVRSYLKNRSALLQVVDGVGAVVISRSISSFKENLDVSQLPAGLYTLLVIDGNETSQERLLIQR